MQKSVKGFLARKRHRPRISTTRKLLLLLKRVFECSDSVDKLKNQSLKKNITEITDSIKKSMLEIKVHSFFYK